MEEKTKKRVGGEGLWLEGEGHPSRVRTNCGGFKKEVTGE